MLEGVYRLNWSTYVIRYNKDGVSKFKEVVPPFQVFVPHKDGEYKDIFSNKPLAKINIPVSEYNDKKDILKAQFGDVYELDRRILITYPLWKKQSQINSRIWYLDIEVIDLNDRSFPDPKYAKAPITHIQVYDSIDNINYIFMTKDFENPINKTKYDDKTKFIVISDEKEMLKQFSSFLIQKNPLVITAWNGDLFDFPYIYNRFKKLGLSPNRLSPLNKTNIKDVNDKLQKVDIVGIEVIDALELYKYIVLEPRQSYALEAIAKVELGEGKGKVDYGEYRNIYEFYQNNYDKFIDYAVQDTIVLKNIIEKTGIMDLALTMSREMGCNVSEVIGTVMPWTIYLNLIMYDKKYIFTENKHATHGRIKGGLVRLMKGMEGLHKWVFSIDLNSLYPSLIQAFNLSPDTHIPYEKLPQDLKMLYDKYQNQEEMNLFNDLKEIQPILKEYNVSFGGLGFFSREKEGFIPELIKELYNERKSEKTKMLMAEAIIANNK